MDLQILFDILTTIVILYLLFFKSYFEEKGKNLATKEDISGITSKIEDIKRESTNLRLELQYSHQIKLSIRMQRIEALREAFQSYFVWAGAIIDFQLTNISRYDTAMSYKQDVNKHRVKFVKDKSLITLYSVDDEFKKLLHNLDINSSILFNWNIKQAIEYSIINEELAIGKLNEPMRQEFITRKREMIYGDDRKEEERLYKVMEEWAEKFEVESSKAIEKLIEEEK